MIEQSKNQGIYLEKSSRDFRFYTKSLVPGRKVYGERLISESGVEYREWSPVRSKIGAALAKNMSTLNLKEGDYVLYLGVASGTTSSHISDIVGHEGLVFGIDISPRVLRDFYFLAQTRKNMVPILADCAQMDQYDKRICECDFIVQDIAQRNQFEIFLKNLKYLRKGGRAFFAVKARSIDVTKNPKHIFEAVRKQLEDNKIKIIDYKPLDPFERDHCAFLIEK